jgi:catechol 2,3-dioxygenase-like lactoylglutathione lyase family enzyme
MGEPVIQVGRISHLGIAVKDCEKTAAFFSRVFGIGPFDIQEYDMGPLAEYYLVDGKPAKPKYKAALFYDGDFFLEVLEVVEGETVHTRFMRQKGEGLQHLCFMVSDTKAALEKLKMEGIEPVIDYQFVTNQNGKKVRIHEVYLNTDEFTGGVTVQLLEYIPEPD